MDQLLPQATGDEPVRSVHLFERTHRLMATECNQEIFVFQPLGRQDVVARLDSGTISLDASLSGAYR